jgi:hypothetical protein
MELVDLGGNGYAGIIASERVGKTANVWRSQIDMKPRIRTVTITNEMISGSIKSFVKEKNCTIF